MTRLTGCKQLYALVPGIAAAWNYAGKSVSLKTGIDTLSSYKLGFLYEHVIGALDSFTIKF